MNTFQALVMAVASAGLLWCVFMLVRNEVVFHVRGLAIDAITDRDVSVSRRAIHLLDATSYWEMIHQYHKWTFAQFYPELAAAVKRQ